MSQRLGHQDRALLPSRSPHRTGRQRREPRQVAPRLSLQVPPALRKPGSLGGPLSEHPGLPAGLRGRLPAPRLALALPRLPQGSAHLPLFRVPPRTGPPHPCAARLRVSVTTCCLLGSQCLGRSPFSPVVVVMISFLSHYSYLPTPPPPPKASLAVVSPTGQGVSKHPLHECH